MSSGQRFSGYTSTFGYATSQTMVLTDLKAWELSPNNTKSIFRPMGAIDTNKIVTARSKPTYRLQTCDLATLFGVVSFSNGKCFDETSTFRLQERADCGTFLTGATHPARTAPKGFMYIDTITAEQDSQEGAYASMMFIALKSGSNPPVANLSTVDLSSIAVPAYVSSYVMGPVYHNGAEIPGVFSQTWTPQINTQPSPSSPGAFDDLVSIITREAEFRFRCLKVDAFDAFNFSGQAVNTSLAFYLQKADPTNANSDGRVAAASTVHVKASCTAGDIELNSISVDGNDDAAVEVIVRPTGTVSFSIASAIP